MPESHSLTNFSRILLKLSGESLQGNDSGGINFPTLEEIAGEIHSVHQKGVEIAIVVGGGNFFRGINSTKSCIQRVTADYMGMLATTMNALALNDALKSLGSESIVMTALGINGVAEQYNREEAIERIEAGKIIIFAGGTGNPFFTTDTAAALRAVEINAQIILKATQVDGVYDRDPFKESGAKLYHFINYEQVLKDKLGIIDLTAISLAMENQVSFIVFNIGKRGNIEKIVSGEKLGTLIAGECDER